MICKISNGFKLYKRFFITLGYICLFPSEHLNSKMQYPGLCFHMNLKLTVLRVYSWTQLGQKS